MIAPLVDEISAEFGDKLRTLKLNTDESPNVATEYGIRSIPTVMIFKNGEGGRWGRGHRRLWVLSTWRVRLSSHATH